MVHERKKWKNKQGSEQVCEDMKMGKRVKLYRTKQMVAGVNS
jgi:hypothetical protein